MRAAHAEKRFAQNAEPLQSFHQLLQGLQVFKTHRILNLLTEAFCTMCSVCLPGHSSDITRLRTTRSQDYSFGNSGVRLLQCLCRRDIEHAACLQAKFQPRSRTFCPGHQLQRMLLDTGSGARCGARKFAFRAHWDGWQRGPHRYATESQCCVSVVCQVYIPTGQQAAESRFSSLVFPLKASFMSFNFCFKLREVQRSSAAVNKLRRS